MIKRDRGEVYGKGKIIPKSITIDNQKQKIETREVITIGENILFDEKYKVHIDYISEDSTITKSPRWISNTMFRMAPQFGQPGGAGGAGSGATAVSRLNVIDPHLVIMMRDVMDSAETAGRLKVCGSAGGGGGGGAVSSDGASARRGWTPNAGDGTDSHPQMYDSSVLSTVSGCIVTNASRDGGAGGPGSNTTSPLEYYGGAGGGGAGGNGGAIVVITTSASSGTTVVTGGAGGNGGTGGGTSGAPAAGATDGSREGRAGTAIHIQI